VTGRHRVPVIPRTRSMLDGVGWRGWECGGTGSRTVDSAFTWLIPRGKGARTE
jgi:hypothetical protein